MVFITHNKKHIPIHGTSLKGMIIIDYASIKKAFGKPNNGDEYKIDAEWDILFEDGTIATIYNYKDGKNYNGKEGTPKTKITDWHIGGHDQTAVEHVYSILKGV
jgi:hypothetical protein